MDLDPSVVWDFAGTLVGTLRERPRQLPATVSRVDPDGTVWLSMPGAEGLVPASTTADVRADDAVTVEWWGNAYHVTGNGTSPSVGTRAAAALRRATAAAAKVAGEAKGIADAVGQHFWADDNGVHVSNEDGNATGGRNILMNSLGILLRQGSAWLASFSDSAVAFYDGLGNAAENIVAQFGADGAQIGVSDESHMTLDYHSMQIVDKEGSTFFYVSDLRSDHASTDEYGEGFYAVVTDTFTSNGIQLSFQLSNTSLIENYKVYVDGAEESSVTKTESSFRFTTAPADGSTVTATYPTADQNVKAYTAGLRENGGNIGVMSFAEGGETTASGRYAHAEGSGTTASGMYSHAEGRNTTASGMYSHVEGRNTTVSGEVSHAEGMYATASGFASHAEGGNTTASGRYAHAEGNGTIANGDYSHAQNAVNIAGYDNQTAIGKYNDNQSGNAFEIGNGTSDTARSNAFAVGWDGTVTHDGDVPWTNLPLTSSVVAFSDGQVPMYRKWGPVVTLCGAVKMTSAQSSNFSVQIGQLPVGCRPKRDLQILCQGSNEDVWLLVVNTAGEVRAGRYRHGASYTAVTTSTWFPFTATFLVA